MADPKPIQQKVSIDADTKGADDVNRALGKVKGQIKETDEAAQRAKAADAARERGIEKLENALRDQITAEREYRQSLKSGTVASAEDEKASEQRRLKIDQLSRSLARIDDEQNGVNREMRESINAHRDLGDKTDESTKKSGFFARQLNNVAQSAGGMIAGFFGLQTVIGYIEKLNEAARITVERLDAITESVNEAAAATLDLQAINLGYSERDEQTITDFSKATGRSFQESAQAYTNFKSQTASLTGDEQESLFNQAVLPYALTTSGSIEGAAQFIGRASKITKDPKEITNLMIKSIALAGESDPNQYLDYAGKLLVDGKSAGLTPAETLSQLGFMGDYDVSEASTGLRNLFSKLGADSATRKKLDAMGVDSSQGIYSTYNQLAQRGTTKEESIDLVGLENERYLTSILGNIEDVNSRREQTIQAVAGDDLVGKFNRELADKSPRHAKALQLSQMQQQLAAVRRMNSGNAQDRQIARTRVEIELEQAVQAGTLEPSAMEARLDRFDLKTGSSAQGYYAALGALRDGEIQFTPQQQSQLDRMGMSQRNFLYDDLNPKVEDLKKVITYQQVLQAVSMDVEDGLLISDLAPGGDQSDYVEISDQVGDDLRRGPNLPTPKKRRNPEPTGDELPELPADLQPAIDDATSGRVFNNYGMLINNAGNPLWDDLDGSDRV